MRPYFMITLSHAERGDRARLDKLECAKRVRELFDCRTILVSKEAHQDAGYHFHIAVLANNASRYTFVRKIREKFPEFDGASIHVSVGKCFITLLAYGTKEDPEPYVWGEDVDWDLVQIARDKLRRNQKKHPQPQPTQTVECLPTETQSDASNEEQRLSEKEMLLIQKERVLLEREALLDERERQLNKKQISLDDREAWLNAALSVGFPRSKKPS